MVDTVGYVYVKVISDSSGFKKAIEKDATKAGKEAAVAFNKPFHDGVTQDLKKLNMTDALKPQLRKWGRDWAATVRKAAQDGTDVRFDLSKVVSNADIKAIATRLKIAPQELADYLEVEIPRAASRGFDAVDKEQVESLNQQKKQQEKYFRWQITTQQKYDRMARKEVIRIRPMSELLDDEGFTRAIRDMAKKFDNIMTPAMRKALENGQKVDWIIDDDIRHELQNIATSSRASFGDVEKHWNKMIRSMVADSRTLRRQGLFAGLRDDVDDADGMVEKFNVSIGKTRNSLRRAGSGGFFAGLTSVFGALIGLAAAFGKAVYKGAKLAADGLEFFGKFLVNIAGKAGKFAGLIGKMGAGMAQFAKVIKHPIALVGIALGALVGGVMLLVKLLGAAVTTIVDLAGVFGMLAAGIGAAVVASAIFVPILISLAAGLGALFIAGMDAAKAIGSYQKAMAETDPKKRAAAMKLYREELAKLGPNTRAAVEATNDLIGSFADFKKSMSEKMFGAGPVGLASALRAAKPLVDALKNGMLGVSDAVGDVLDKFLRLGQDAGFMKDFNTLWTAAAPIVRNVGSALVNFFAGLTAFFAIVSPYAEKFAGWILDISEKFRLWAQSDEGREKMSTFFSDAWQLAKNLWDVISSLTGVVVAFFAAIIGGPEGEEAGGFLQSIADWLDRVKAKIEELDKNGKLKEWFQNAKDTATTLWNALKFIAGELRKLNTPENREFLRQLIIWMQRLWTIAKFVFNAIKIGITVSFAPFKPVIQVIKTLIDWVSKLIGWIGRIKWPKAPSWLSKIPGFAAGGIAAGPMRAIVGEGGPEAMIPLTRPLSQVDPSVRGMAAMIRGGPRAPAAAVTALPGRQMTNYWNITTPSEDPRVVASQVINRMAAMAG